MISGLKNIHSIINKTEVFKHINNLKIRCYFYKDTNNEYYTYILKFTLLQIVKVAQNFTNYNKFFGQ